MLERFLARLSQSEYQEKFVFKGGLLLAQYLTIGRETTDADFLLRKMQSEAAVIETAVKDMTKVDLGDGFLFSVSGVVELKQPHMAYPGFRVSINASLGKMKDKIQIDLGVGDLVKPIEDNFEPFQYKGKPIFEGEISLYVYPVETIFAEKLQTVISKNTFNSRMKDYHDLILIIREKDLIDVTKISKIVTDTFRHRSTELKIPVQFDKDGMTALQKLWTEHLKGLGSFKEKLKLPNELSDLLVELNSWLKKHKIES